MRTQIRRRLVAAGIGLGIALAAAVPTLAAPAGRVGRSVTHPYQTGCRLDRGLLLPCQAGAGAPYIGGFVSDVTTVTFAGTRRERHVSIVVRDLSGLPVPFSVNGVDEAQPFDMHAFCGQGNFNIPAYAVVDVYVWQAYVGTGPCPGVVTVGAATTGTVTATFRK